MSEQPYITLDEERRRRAAGHFVDRNHEPPRPLMREIPPPNPFPIDSLGDVLAPAARSIHDRVQAPLAICAQSVLAAATLAVQGHADVVLPIGNGSHGRPISNYFCSIAATGERKSACDSEATRPIREHEADLRKAYSEQLHNYRNDREAWERARENVKKKHKGDRAAIKSGLDALEPEPKTPLTPHLVCSEPTFEGLCKLFVVGQPGLGLFSTEGGQFIGGHAMKQENKLATAAGLSGLWDGEPIRRIRAGDGALLLPGRRLTAHLMVQPDVATTLFGDRLLEDQGFLSRMLVSAPESTAGSRFQHEERTETEQDLERYSSILTDILNMPPPLADQMLNEFEPRKLPMDAKAQCLWRDFADHVEKQVGPGGALEPICGLANKLAEHAARLAAVLTLIRNMSAEFIIAEEMGAGIVVAQHYADEALRLFGRSRANPRLMLAQRLLDWMQTSWSEDLISLPDIYQRSLNAIRDKKNATALVAVLEDHGHLQPLPGGAIVGGERRRKVWRIVRG